MRQLVLVSWLVCGWLWSGCGTPPPQPLRARSVAGSAVLDSANEPTWVVFKFRAGTEVGVSHGALVVRDRTDRDLADLAAQGLTAAQVESDVGAVNAVAANYHLAALEPLFTNPAELNAFRERGEKQVSRRLPDLTLYFRLRVPPPTDATAPAAEIRHLRSLENAYAERVPRQPKATSPPVPLIRLAAAAAGGPSYQDYVNGASMHGIAARCAWGYAGGAGDSVQIVDVELGWNSNLHLPTLDPSCTTVPGNDHGTQVLGVLEATRDANGVAGIAYGAHVTCQLVANGDLADAITKAAMKPGVDIVLVEHNLQLPPHWTDVPAQCGAGEMAAIRTAAANGVVVVEAAGENPNQSVDLDTLDYRSCINTGPDFAGVLVASAAKSNGYAAADDYTNYGSPITLYAWGESVTTTASLSSGYTSSFGGTSAAAAMVAGAFADLKGVAKRIAPQAGPALLTDLLFNNGTLNAGSKHIGRMPDLSRAIPALYQMNGLTPPAIPADCSPGPTPPRALNDAARAQSWRHRSG